MSTYIIGTYTRQVTRKQARQINEQIAAIDTDAVFVRHYAPGNHIHGWIERPNDGSNQQDWRHVKNMRMLKIADKVLGLTA